MHAGWLGATSAHTAEGLTSGQAKVRGGRSTVNGTLRGCLRRLRSLWSSGNAVDIFLVSTSNRIARQSNLDAHYYSAESSCSGLIPLY